MYSTAVKEFKLYLFI